MSHIFNVLRFLFFVMFLLLSNKTLNVMADFKMCCFVLL